MSTPQKLRGGPETQIRQFKKLWLHSLAEPARDYWRALFVSEATQADIRRQILAKLKFHLVADKQLNAFRKWVDEQDALDAENFRQAQEETMLKEEFADLTDDQIRKLVIRGTVARAKSQGDWKLGLAAVDRDLKAQALAFDQEKFKESLRSKLETALDALAEHVKGSAKARTAYENFRATVAETTK